MILIVIILCMLTGIMCINLIKSEIKLTKLLLLSLPIGIVIHTLIFTLLIFLKLYYGMIPFVIVSLLSLLTLLKQRIKIINDLKNIPIYYILIILYIAFRLIVLGVSGFFEFYNYDEFTAYSRGSIALHYAKDFFSFYETYAPINYFLGTKVLQVSGYTISIARIFSTVYFVLTSMLIYSALSDHKVNKHISALIATVFLFSSTEIIQLSKSFYTNIIFMFYFCSSIYYLISYYYINKEKGIDSIGYLLLIGMALTRQEGLYYAIVVFVLINIINMIKKRISIKSGILSIIMPISFYFIYNIFKLPFNQYFYSLDSENLPFFERIIERLSFDNIKLFINNVYDQTFNFGYYFFNYLIYVIFIIALVLVIIKLIKKDTDKNYKKFYFFITLFQLGYIGVILITEIFLFTIVEYQLAASFSRYTMMVIPLSFILIGIIIFKDTKPIINEKKPIKYEKPKCLLIIPAYNERLNIIDAYKKIMDYNKKSKIKLDAIVINDCSTDDTEEILLKNRIPHISLVHNLGIGGCVQTGYKYALEHGYDIAVQYDGDGQHDINYIDKLLNPIIKGEVSFTIGSRFIDKKSSGFKSTFFRRFGIKIISFITKIFAGRAIYDTTSGYRAANRDIIEFFAKDYPTEYPEPITNVELISMNYKIKEVSVEMKDREKGQSSIKAWKKVYYMINVIISIIMISMKGDK